MIATLQRMARGLATLAACLSAGQAQAQAPVSALKIEFLQPTGQVSPDEGIVIALRITNTDAGQAFSFNPTTGVAGMPASALPQTAWALNPVTLQYEQVAFASYTSFRLAFAYDCADNTFNGGQCTSGAYVFALTLTPFAWDQPYQLSPGQSMDNSFGVLMPDQGNAPEGTYSIYNAKFWLGVNGLAADGRELSGFAILAETCGVMPRSDCTAPGQIFTRTVVAVPEPASAALLALGLLGVAAIEKRRRTRR